MFRYPPYAQRSVAPPWAFHTPAALLGFALRSFAPDREAGGTFPSRRWPTCRCLSLPPRPFSPRDRRPRSFQTSWRNRSCRCAAAHSPTLRGGESWKFMPASGFHPRGQSALRRRSLDGSAADAALGFASSRFSDTRWCAPGTSRFARGRRPPEIRFRLQSAPGLVTTRHRTTGSALFPPVIHLIAGPSAS
jgi:hypothetical protein